MGNRERVGSFVLSALLLCLSQHSFAQATDQLKAQALPPATCGFALDSQARASASATADFTGSGVLFARYALGLRGAALIAGTHIDQTPANLSEVLAAINAHMSAFSAAHDVDNSGPPIDGNDAIIIARYLAGFRGDALVAGLTLTGTRKLGSDIETYIANGCPTTVTPPNPSDLPLTCTLFGPGVIPLASNAAFSASCTSSNATTAVSTPVTGLNFTWTLTPAGRFTVSSGCTAATTGCTVNAATEGDATVTLRATKTGYVSTTANLNTKVTSNVLSITALTPKDVVLAPTQARPTIRASYANSNPNVSITTNSIRLFVDGIDVTAQSTITASSVSYTPTADLSTGPHTLYLSVDNSDNVTAQAVWGFELDVLATYELAFITPATPADNATVKTPTIEATLSATANKTYANQVTLKVVNGTTTKTVNAQIKFVNSGTSAGTGSNTTSTPIWSATVPLTAGVNTLTATATFADGQTRTATRTITFDAPPVVVFTSPNDFQTFGAINPTSPRDLTGNVERPVTLTGTVNKPFAQITRVMINQQSATLTAASNATNSTQTSFSFPNFFLREGTNLVTATATDASGQVGSASLTLYVDQTAPMLTVEAPVNMALAGLVMPSGVSVSESNAATPANAIPRAITSNAKIDVRGVVNDAVEGGLKVPYPTVTIKNDTTGLATTGKVSDRYYLVEDIALDVGQNELTVTATDWVGNARSQKLVVSRVNVGSNRITLAGGNRQRGALNTELAKPLVVTAIDKNGLPLANIPLTFEVLRGTGSINPATTSSTTSTSSGGSGSITTTLPNVLGGANQPPVKPNGANPARRLIINTDVNGRAAVWFILGRQSGEAGNIVQVSASDNNAANGTSAPNQVVNTQQAADITESVVFTATAERGVPAKILAEGGGAQYAETSGQPLDALTAVTYDGEVNPVPGAVVVYVIDLDGGVNLDDGARFNASSATNAQAISANGKVLITVADNNGRSAARPTMGTAPGTVRVSAYAMPASTNITTALVESFASGAAFTNNAGQTLGMVGLAGYQIGVLQQSDGPTQFTGKILDHTGKPLQGVRVTISRTPLSVTTDANGNFEFADQVPQGKLDLFVDGRAVTGTTPLPATNGASLSSPTQYPSLHFELLAIRGQKNILPHPIYLPPLLMSQAKTVGGNEDVSITIPGFEGFEMIVRANSVTFPDGSRVGPLVVSPVHADRLPMVPPGGNSTFMSPAWTIQPSGTRFDPPIEVRIANSQNLKPGQTSDIYQWDHDLATFVPMGRATVSDDGSQLVTDPGSGITKAGWGGPPPPPPPPPPDCGKGGPPPPEITGLSADIQIPDPYQIRRYTAVPFRAESATQGCTTLEYRWQISGGASSVATGQNVVVTLDGPGEGTATVTLTCKGPRVCGQQKTATQSDSVSFVVTPDDDLRVRLAKCKDVQCMYALQDEAARRIAELEKLLQPPRACALDPVCSADVRAQLARARTDFNAAKVAIGVTSTAKWVADALSAINNSTAITSYTEAIRELKAGRWERIAELERSGNISPALIRALTLSAIAGELSIPETGLEALVYLPVIRGLMAIARTGGRAAFDAELASIPRLVDGTIDINALRNAPVYERLLRAETAAEQAVLRELWESKQYLARGTTFEAYAYKTDYTSFRYVGQGNYPIDFQLGNLGVSFKTWNGGNLSTIQGYIRQIMDGLKLDSSISPGVNQFLLDIRVPPGTSPGQIDVWLKSLNEFAENYAFFGGVPPRIIVKTIP